MPRKTYKIEITGIMAWFTLGALCGLVATPFVIMFLLAARSLGLQL